MTTLNSELSFDELDIVSGGEVTNVRSATIMGYTFTVGIGTDGCAIGLVEKAGKADRVYRTCPG